MKFFSFDVHFHYFNFFREVIIIWSLFIFWPSYVGLCYANRQEMYIAFDQFSAYSRKNKSFSLKYSLEDSLMNTAVVQF